MREVRAGSRADFARQNFDITATSTALVLTILLQDETAMKIRANRLLLKI